MAQTARFRNVSIPSPFASRKVALQGRNSKETRVSDIMTRNVIVVTPQTSNRDCMALMREKRIRHLPVVEQGVVLGMLSIRDLMGWLILPDEPIAHEGRRGEIRTRALDTVETLKQG